MAALTDAETELYANKLVGKSNYFRWRRLHDRAHRVKDTWGLVTATEKIKPEPKIQDYYVYQPLPDPPAGPSTRSKTPDPSPEEPKGPFDSNLTFASWQIAIKKWENQKPKIQLAKEIILNSVSSSIAIELQDRGNLNPNNMVQYLKDTYGINEEFARQQLLSEVHSLKLSDCKNISDYINRHRELQADLKRAGMPTYDESVFATHVIRGLPDTYNSFKERWDWDRAKDADLKPNLHFLMARLLTMEEEIRKQTPKPKKTSDRNKNSRKNTSTVVCTYPKCGRKGHDEDHCFVKHPEQKPDWYKQKEEEWAAQQKAAGNKTDSAKGTNADKNKGGGKKVFTAAAFFDHDAFSIAIRRAIDAAYPRDDDQVFDTTAFAREFREAFIVADVPPPPDDPITSIRRLFPGQSRSIDIDHILPSIRGLFNERPPMFADLTYPPLLAVLVATSGTQVSRSNILLDSGANGHIFNDKKVFVNFVPTSFDISTAGGVSSLNVQGGGDVHLDFRGPDDSVFSLVLSDVAYCPEAYCNLVSLSLLAKKANLHGEWNAGGITLKSSDNEFLTTAAESSGLFFLDPLLPNPVAPLHAAVVDFNHPVWEWHRRLGHLGWQSMINLLKVSTGIPLTEAQIKPFIHEICPVCAVTKALVKIPRDPASRRSSVKGHLMHADQWGPYPVEGYDGTFYALFFTDDFSRFTWVQFYSRPAQMPTVFKAMHKQIEKAHNIIIRNYRFDGQFQVGDVMGFIQKKHIGVEPTPAYHHYAAGVEERVHRTVREKAAPMMQEVKIAGHTKDIIIGNAQELLRGNQMPERLFPLAIAYATWLKNRAPTRALRDKITPWEAFYDVKPHFQRESIWGSRVFVTLPPEEGRDRAPKIHGNRGWIGSFVGCFSESIYEIWNEDKHRVFHIGVARVQQGAGLDDPHDGESYDDRNPVAILDDDSLPPDDDDNDSIFLSDNNMDPDPDTGFDNLSLSPNDLDDNLISFSDDDLNLDKLDPVSIIDDDFADPNHPWWLHSDEELPLDQDVSDIESNLEHDDDPLNDDNRRSSSPYHIQQHDVTQDDPVLEQRHDSPQQGEQQSKTKSTPYRLQSDQVMQDDLSADPQDMTEQSRFWAFAIDKSSFPKCAACFLGRRTCDGERPCHSCKRAGRHCTDVTDLHLQNFPDRAKKVLLAARALEDQTPVLEHKCRRCAKNRFICRKNPEDDKCVSCAKRGYVCVWDPITTDSPQDRGKRPFIPISQAVPQSEACAPCLKARVNCDGNTPCSRCAFYNISCVPQIDETQPRCANCIDRDSRCDRGRPCGKCTKEDKTCVYTDQNGLVVRRYNLNHYRRSHGWEDITEDTDDCGFCSVSGGRVCDQNQPCYRCVLAHMRGLATAPTSCVYRSPDHGGSSESWKLSCWTLGTRKDEYSDPPVILEENWKQILRNEQEQRRQTRSRGGINLMSRRQPPTRALSPERPQEQEWRLQFESDFPNGAIEVPTSAQGRLCAWFALRHSIHHQIPGIRVPDVEELQAIYNRLAGENPEFEMGNSDTFRLDQLILVAQTYLAQFHTQRRIGLVYPHNGQRHFAYIYAQSDHLSNEPVLWLYNDNHDANSWRDAHFWGLRQPTPGERQAQEEQRRDDPDDSDASSGDDDPDVRRRMQQPRVDDDVAEFIEEGSMRKQASTSSRTQARMVMLAALANILPLPDLMTLQGYDAEDGPEPASYAEAMRMPDSEGWQGAIDREIDSLRENEVFKLVRRSDLPPGRRLLSGKLIFKRKVGYNPSTKEYKRKYKARLVAKGFQQEEGIDYEETFATVVKSSSYRTLVAVFAALGWHVYLMDVKTAFLYGELDVEIYMKPPAGFKIPRGMVLMLLKALYGLKQSPRVWYEKLSNTLVKDFGFRISSYDQCVFIREKIIIAIWVDDLLIGTSDPEEAQVFRRSMSEKFKMVDEGLCTFYLGMNMEQTDDGIVLHQAHYIDICLKRFGLENLPYRRTPLPPNTRLVPNDGQASKDDIARFASLVGSKNWLANQTRFDIAHATSLLSRFSTNPSQAHIDAAHHVWGYLKSTKHYGLLYQRTGSLNLFGYTDSDYAMCPETRRSTTGWIFFLAGAPISWCSQRQKSTALSTTQAEWVAGAEGAREAVWLRWFINDLNVAPPIEKVPLFMDNNAVERLSRNPEFHQRIKHIEVRYNFLRERVTQDKDISTIRVNSKDNIADLLTKPLSKPQFVHLLRLSGMVDAEDGSVEQGAGEGTTQG